MNRYDNALQANHVILGLDPSVIGMRMNQGLTYLAEGDLDQAQREYDTLIEEVQRQIAQAHAQNQEPSASTDLQNLVDQLDGNPKAWTEAPEATLVPGDHAQIKAFADTEITRLKEATLALEYTGQLQSAQTVMSVSPFAFGNIANRDEQGYVTEFSPAANATFPAATPSVDVQFSFTGPTPTGQIMWKVFHNGVEDASFRNLWDPDLSGSDTWYKTIGYNYTNVFVLSSGEYAVELDVDYHLVQTGTFYAGDQ